MENAIYEVTNKLGTNVFWSKDFTLASHEYRLRLWENCHQFIQFNEYTGDNYEIKNVISIHQG